MAMAMPKNPKFHIAMFPWFAFGHMTPFLHLANKLAERGHKTTFILPQKAQSQLQSLNSHPTLISFHPLTIPHVDGLPPGAETASDIPISLTHLLAAAVDRATTDQLESVLRESDPEFLFYDSSHLAPVMASRLGIKAVCYNVVSATSIAIALVPARGVSKDRPVTEAELAVPPPGYPSSTAVLRRHEARSLLFISEPFGDGISFYERTTAAMKESDAISIRTCREIEGNLCDYIGNQYGKPVLLTGPVLPEPSPAPLEEKWAQWLGRFKPGSVIFCAFGSQYILENDQFQELLLGFELTGLPFLLALKPPTGAATIEEALPEGFKERVEERGAVHGGWLQQPAILSHPSVGCFVNHCGFGSMWESLMSDCQIVLVPYLGDQILNTRVLAGELKVAVEVEREENNGWVSKERLCKAIKSVMEEDSELGWLVRKNHARWKETLVRPGFMDNYVDEFVGQLQELLDHK